jgi:hypothetical protein
MKETLTRAVMAYRKSGEGWKELQERISLIVYRYPSKWTDWDEDKCSEFFLSFFPRIPNIVKRYQPRYRFETYLYSNLRWFTKTFNENLKKRELYESWSIEISESEALRKQRFPEYLPSVYINSDEKNLLESPEDCPFELEENGRLKDPALRRRVLYTILLRAADIEDHRVPVLATLTDVNENWLYEQTQKVRKQVSGKIMRREKLRHRRNEYWYHLDNARKRIDTVSDSENRNLWRKKAGEWERRYISAAESIRALQITTTHKEIGQILNTHPGTVSSGLHLLRKKWYSMERWTRERTSG